MCSGTRWQPRGNICQFLSSFSARCSLVGRVSPVQQQSHNYDTRCCPTCPAFCHLVTKICQALHSHIAVPPLWNKLRQYITTISNPPYELTKTSFLAICPQLFHFKLLLPTSLNS